jgi:hypothetical protein
MVGRASVGRSDTRSGDLFSLLSLVVVVVGWISLLAHLAVSDSFTSNGGSIIVICGSGLHAALWTFASIAWVATPLAAGLGVAALAKSTAHPIRTWLALLACLVLAPIALFGLSLGLGCDMP